MKLPTLYKFGKKGQRLDWTIEVEGSTIITTHGGVDGAKIEHRDEVLEGKNRGRKNATTAEEQAKLEAGSRWTKKKKLGYTEDTSCESNLECTRPMLALEYAKQAHRMAWPCYVQPKLNGIRCIIRVVGNTVRYSSRNGTLFYGLEFMTDAIIESGLVPEGCELDGELYVHGMSLQEISSLVRKSTNVQKVLETLSATIEYHIFDIVDTKATFTRRLQTMRGMGKKLTQVNEKLGRDVIRRVPTMLAPDPKNAEWLLDDCIGKGFEGIVLRHPEGLYVPNYRSEYLLKYKKFKDAEFEVIGGEYGRGKDKDIFIWKCKTAEGHEFSVKMAGSYALNEHRASKYKDYLGKMLTVKYQSLTPYGVPEFPVGLEFRDYE